MLCTGFLVKYFKLREKKTLVLVLNTELNPSTPDLAMCVNFRPVCHSSRSARSSKRSKLERCIAVRRAHRLSVASPNGFKLSLCPLLLAERFAKGETRTSHLRVCWSYWLKLRTRSTAGPHWSRVNVRLPPSLLLLKTRKRSEIGQEAVCEGEGRAHSIKSR